MKKIILIVFLSSIFVFFLLNSKEEVLETKIITNNSPLVVSDKTTNNQKISKKQNAKNKTPEVNHNQMEVVNRIKVLVANTLKEINDCEEKFDQIITVPIDEISSIDNQALIYIIDDFDEMNVSSASLSKLLVSISENDLNLSEEGPLSEVYQELSQVRHLSSF